jgi:hypothetical protein
MNLANKEDALPLWAQRFSSKGAPAPVTNSEHFLKSEFKHYSGRYISLTRTSPGGALPPGVPGFSAGTT